MRDLEKREEKNSLVPSVCWSVLRRHKKQHTSVALLGMFFTVSGRKCILWCVKVERGYTSASLLDVDATLKREGEKDVLCRWRRDTGGVSS